MAFISSRELFNFLTLKRKLNVQECELFKELLNGTSIKLGHIQFVDSEGKKESS